MSLPMGLQTVDLEQKQTALGEAVVDLAPEIVLAPRRSQMALDLVGLIELTF